MDYFKHKACSFCHSFAGWGLWIAGDESWRPSQSMGSQSPEEAWQGGGAPNPWANCQASSAHHALSQMEGQAPLWVLVTSTVPLLPLLSLFWALVFFFSFKMEFFFLFIVIYWGSPENPSLMGLNVGAGVEVKLRLRRPNQNWSFFPFEQLLDTMLHELCHIEHGPHNSQFYKLWDELRKVYVRSLLLLSLFLYHI